MTASLHVPDEKTVECHKKGSLAIVTFHTGQLDAQTLLWFIDIMRDIAASPDIKEVHIQSSGRNFSVGTDVEFDISVIEGKQYLRMMGYLDLGHRVFDILRDLKAVTVAKVSGAAWGGGFELALACDYRVVSPSVNLSFPECRLGIFPGWGGIEMLCEKVPIPLTKWIVYTGKSVTTDLAKELGVADVVVKEEELAGLGELGFPKPVRTKGVAERPASDEVPERLAATADFFSRPLTEMLKEVPGEVLTAEQHRYRRFLRSLSQISLQYAERIFNAVGKYPPLMVRRMRDTIHWDLCDSPDPLIGLCSIRDGRLGIPQFVHVYSS